MDNDTRKNREWLDKRFADGVKAGEYFAHQPIYGYKKGHTEGRDLIRYLRNLSILVKLSRFDFNNFMDVGGAEGYMANLVRTAFKVDSYTCDLSFEANLRARELFGIESLAMDLSNLPFKDEAFDVVLCSETLEHVSNPVQAICELKRITKKALIITTEAVCYDSLERKMRMMMVDLTEPHCDRNWFLADDFVFILGENTAYESTIYDPRIADKAASLEDARKILETYTDHRILKREGVGLTILLSKIRKNESSKVDIKNLVNIILNTTANVNYNENLTKEKIYSNGKLTDLLRCPKCLEVIKINKDTLVCSSCGEKYAVKNNIPVMYTSEKDSDYLARKWEKRYLEEYSDEYKNLIKLKRTFEHSAIKPNFVIKMIAWRILKIEKFVHNIQKTLEQKSISDSSIYFLNAIKKKILREMRRVVERIKKLKLTDFKTGDSVEFAKDFSQNNGKILIRQGTFGKIISTSTDNVAIKVEGVDEIVHLWSSPNHADKPTLSFIKIVRK